MMMMLGSTPPHLGLSPVFSKPEIIEIINKTFNRSGYFNIKIVA